MVGGDGTEQVAKRRRLMPGGDGSANAPEPSPFEPAALHRGEGSSPAVSAGGAPAGSGGAAALQQGRSAGTGGSGLSRAASGAVSHQGSGGKFAGIHARPAADAELYPAQPDARAAHVSGRPSGEGQPFRCPATGALLRVCCALAPLLLGDVGGHRTAVFAHFF
jgi:hypothetical protein